jgi:hypothetical protein
MPLTTEQNIFWVATFWANRQSITVTRIHFRRQFGRHERLPKASLWHRDISDNSLAGTNVFQKRFSMICASVMSSSEHREQPTTPYVLPRIQRCIDCDWWPPSGGGGKYWIGWSEHHQSFLCTCYVIISHWNGAQIIMDKIVRAPNCWRPYWAQRAYGHFLRKLQNLSTTSNVLPPITWFRYECYFSLARAICFLCIKDTCLNVTNDYVILIAIGCRFLKKWTYALCALGSSISISTR